VVGNVRGWQAKDEGRGTEKGREIEKVRKSED